MDKYVWVRIFLILLAIVTLFTLVHQYTNRQKVMGSERFYDDINKLIPLVKNGGVTRESGRQVQPSQAVHDEDFKAVNFTSPQLPSDCFPKDRLTADDLLPRDQANSRWAQLNPAGQGDVKDQNFLQAGMQYGINTTGGTKTKNANLSIRSEPVNPQQVVSPWIQSTIQPDLLRRPLEIGENC